MGGDRSSPREVTLSPALVAEEEQPTQPGAISAVVPTAEVTSGNPVLPGTPAVNPTGPEVVVILSDDSVESGATGLGLETVISSETVDGSMSAPAVVAAVVTPASPTPICSGPPWCQRTGPRPCVPPLKTSRRRRTTDNFP